MSDSGVEEKMPKVGTGVFVIKDRKILLGKRIGNNGKGTWGLTGGHLEYGESFDDCACRETYEEAGIKIKNVKFITATNDVFDDKHYVTLYFLAAYDSGKVDIMEPDTFEKWAWFGWNELPEPLFAPLKNLKDQGYDPFLEQ